MSKKSKTNDKFKRFAANANQQTKTNPPASKFDGFTRLTPTPIGEEYLSNIRKIMSKKLEEAEPAKQQPVVVPVEIPTLTEADVNRAVKFAKDGKYHKVRKVLNQNILVPFIRAVTNRELTEEDLRMVEKVLRVAKSIRDYDGEGKDLISDAEYDALLAKYLADPSDPDEPTGYTPVIKGAGMEKVGIKFPTLHNNMDKSYIVHEGDPIPNGVKEETSIEKFLQKIYRDLGLTSEDDLELEISPKIDGVSVNGQIVNDMLVDPQSRGDEDSSVLIKGLNGLQVTTMKDNDKQFGIQYEMFVTEEDRKALSQYLNLEQDYVSCRHAASGLMSRLAVTQDPELVQFVSLYPIMAEGLDGTYSEVIDYLDNFKIVPKDMIERITIHGTMGTLLKKIEKHFDNLKKARGTLSYAIDGMVITVTDDEYQTTIGREGRTNKYQIALKFDPANAEAKIKAIWLDKGSKGYRTIQLDLDEPVFLDGVRYDHVPVLSVNLFNDLDLRQGSVVSIHRVGDVIPAIEVKKSGGGAKVKLPDACPTCGQPLVIKAGKLYCSNRMCKDNLIGRLLMFMSRLGMEDYGASFVETLIDKFNVTSIEELFSLDENAIEKSGINSKKLREFPDKLRKAVESTKDFKIIGAMGIPGIGNARAKLLLKEFSLESLANFDVRKYIDNQEKIEHFMLGLVGPQTVEYAISYVFSSQFRLDVAAMLPYIKKRTDFTDTPTVRVGHTGFEHDRVLEALIEELGYEYVDGTSFDILVTGDSGSDSTKMKRAKKKELPIFTIDEFIEKYGVKPA